MKYEEALKSPAMEWWRLTCDDKIPSSTSETAASFQKLTKDEAMIEPYICTLKMTQKGQFNSTEMYKDSLNLPYE